ncbi:MAG: L-2-amino-thiazoline-4-carboxylic acid hydrolase [Promethearchaeota archaeon]
MEKARYVYNEKASILVSIKELIRNNLKGFAEFLEHIQKEKPHLIDAYLEEVISKCNINEDYGIIVAGEDEIFQNNPKLLNSSINIILNLLNYTRYQKDSNDEKININMVDLVKVYTNFDYIQASSLLRVMSREEAISFIKEYISQQVKKKNNPNNYYNNFEELIENFVSINKTWQAHDGKIMIVNGNKMILKVNKCRWAEELLEQGCDKELCFSMMCYQDFAQVKNYNPSFTLTRTKTIMQGDDYCDFCYHDNRALEEINHPSIEFWKNFD